MGTPVAWNSNSYAPVGQPWPQAWNGSNQNQSAPFPAQTNGQAFSTFPVHPNGMSHMQTLSASQDLSINPSASSSSTPAPNNDGQNQSAYPHNYGAGQMYGMYGANYNTMLPPQTWANPQPLSMYIPPPTIPPPPASNFSMPSDKMIARVVLIGLNNAQTHRQASHLYSDIFAYHNLYVVIAGSRVTRSGKTCSI